MLGDVVRDVQQNWAFEKGAIVLLPDYLHAIWTLPLGDDNDSGRWSVIKKNMSVRFLASGGRDAVFQVGRHLDIDGECGDGIDQLTGLAESICRGLFRETGDDDGDAC